MTEQEPSWNNFVDDGIDEKCPNNIVQTQSSLL